MPDLERQFRLLDPAFELPATDGLVVATWAIDPAAPDVPGDYAVIDPARRS